MSRAEHLRLRHERDGVRHALNAEGELDLLSAPLLEATIASLCEDGALEIVIDLHRVDFVDSAGLRALVHTRRHCEERGCDFSLARVRPPTRRLFEVTGLAGRLSARGHSLHGRAASGRGAAGPFAGRRPELEVPLDLNLDAPRSARHYVRDLLRAHPSKSLCETAMLLASDLVTPIVARQPAKFLRTGELRVWVHGEAVRVELLVRDGAPSGDAGPVYDAEMFARLGAQLVLEQTDEGTRVAFELDAAHQLSAEPAAGGSAQPGPATRGA